MNTENISHHILSKNISFFFVFKVLPVFVFKVLRKSIVYPCTTNEQILFVNNSIQWLEMSNMSKCANQMQMSHTFLWLWTETFSDAFFGKRRYYACCWMHSSLKSLYVYMKSVVGEQHFKAEVEIGVWFFKKKKKNSPKI